MMFSNGLGVTPGGTSMIGARIGLNFGKHQEMGIELDWRGIRPRVALRRKLTGTTGQVEELEDELHALDSVRR
ncbi:hypothetical protein HY251_16395, partial [bacterium]|nr:hypothetical protein [bacterium]